jgi:predicted GIY-YIG superfamily endonuclease
MTHLRKKDIGKAKRIGTVYLLHFDPAYRHCQHYVGFTERPIDERFAEHLNGTGSSLTRAAIDAGCVLSVTRTWKGVDQSVEMIIKSRAESPKLCPVCNPENWQNLAHYEKEN